MHSIKFETTLDDLVEFALHIHNTTPTSVRSKHVRLLLMPAVLIILGIVGIVAGFGLIGIFLVVWSLVTAIINYATYPGQLRKHFRKFYQDLDNQSATGEVILEVSADGVKEESEGTTRHDSWSRIGSVEETSEAVHMMIGGASAYLILKARILEGDLDTFTNAAREFWEASRA